MSETPPQLLIAIRNYLTRQNALISFLKENYRNTNPKTDDWLQGADTTHLPSSIIVDDGEWVLRPHGDGILFKNITSNKKIDVHTGIEDGSIFDAWRLYTYLKSIQYRLQISENIIKKNFTSEELNLELIKLEKLKLITKVESPSDHFRLVDNII